MSTAFWCSSSMEFFFEKFKIHISKKGQPSASSSPLAQGQGKGPTTLGLLYAYFPHIFAGDCFQDSSMCPHGTKFTFQSFKKITY